MAINGRINVDVLFHDTDGTASIRVVSLDESTEYTTGKVAIVSGTVGTAAVAITLAPTTYKDASGNAVSFTEVSRVAFLASRECLLRDLSPIAVRSNNALAVMQMQASSLEVAPVYSSGTASYTLVMYGT